MPLPVHLLNRLLFLITTLCAPTLFAQTNGVLREVYYNISGGTVDGLINSPNYPNRPDEEFIETLFEAPTDFADNYGQRMRALLVPPITGNYVFWIASDDNSALYLSTDEDPAHKTLIANESAWTPVRAWNTHPSQKSVSISLNSANRYYIEALQAEGGGGDNLAVAWQKPGDPAPADGSSPIPGNFLIPFGVGPPSIAVQPVNISVVEGGGAAFSVQLSRSLGATFQWQRENIDIPGATNSSYAFSPVSLSDNNSGFRCFIVNAYGTTNTTIAKLFVTPDVTPPTLSSLGSLGDPQVLTVIFSEPVELATAESTSSYTIDNGINVLSAALAADLHTVVLNTTAMTPDTTYTLSIKNVRDRATAPNTIVTTQRTFSLNSTPLDIAFTRPPVESLGPSTRRGPIIISEIMYHPTNRVDGKNVEFVELFNSNPFFEDISGYRLTGQIDFQFPSNTVLNARSFLVVAAVPADIQAIYGISNVTGPYTNKLSNNSGNLRLRNRQGGIVFEVDYASDAPWPVAADGSGHSLVLSRPSLGERNPQSWSASDLIGGSPGTAESSSPNPYRTVVINEFLAHTDPPDLDYIELFNYNSSPVDISGCVLSDNPALNRFIVPNNTLLQPKGFIHFDETQLGFRLGADGESIYFKDPNNTRIIDALRYRAQENSVPTGRYPDGASEFYRLQASTPGAKNTPRRISNVVLNEIMYAPVSGDDNDQYVEIYNRSTSSVNLSGWRLSDGVDYAIPSGISLAANGYLVIAKNAAHLMTNYPNLSGANTLGNFNGKLGSGGERIALTMPDEIVSTNSAGIRVTNIIHIAVDEVTYGTGGRWGKWAHGGGSSLESIDPRSDHRLAPNWADSDESAKSPWVNIEYTGVLDNGNGAADSLQIILLGPGECLIDNVEVIPNASTNRISNSTFETGLTGWFSQGNHEDTSLETAEGFNSANSLHLRAIDRGDTGANRIRTRLTSAVTAGQTATLRAKVRWLKGNPEILLRLKGNWLEATGNIVAAKNLGTPGAPNSCVKPNAGPAITAVRHFPVLPAANQLVTVAAQVNDPDGLASLVLKYRVDPSTNLVGVTMINNGAGLFSASIPGQIAGKLVAFHIQASDNFSLPATTLFPNDAPVRECLIRWGDPAQTGNFGTYRLWMTQATFNRWSTRVHLSNKPLDCTFVYGNNRVVYNMGAEYAGSPYHAPGFNTPTGNVCDYAVIFPSDDPLLGETDATFQWPGNGGGDNSYQREQTAYWIGSEIGLPYCYRRHINLFVNGVRRAQMFEDVQQPNGDMTDEFFPEGENGDLHKIQLWFEFDDAASTFTPNGASLQQFTTTGGQKKLARYRWTFAKRAVQDSASNYTNLFSLVDSVNFSGLGANYRRQLEATVDVDNFLKTYAVEHVVGNNDSFAYGGGQNMYTYKPVGDTWKMMIWDIDFAFNSQGPTGDNLLQGIGRSNGIDLGEPAYRRRYWQILQDIATGPLVSTKANPLLTAKYNAMVANGRTVDSPSSILSFINSRRTYILNLINTNVASNFGITLNSGADFSTNRNLISITGTAPINARIITINGVAYAVTWTSVSNWTAQVVLASGGNPLVVQGLDAQGNLLSGANVTINVNYTGGVEAPEDKLVINEIMYHPSVPEAAFIEIYNTSAANGFDLSGWRLSGVDFTFPDGTVIPPGGYLVIAEDRGAFAAAYGRTIPVAGEFDGELQTDGETLRLIKPGATPEQDLTVDEVRYDSAAPWPVAGNSGGASLQLIDSSQDNSRVANWAAVASGSGPTPQWRYVTVSGTGSSSVLYMYLQSAGSVYIDDLKIVPGSVPESGVNSVQNGDFESAFPGPWTVSANHSGSAISSAIKHSGANSLHLVASSGGTTQGSSIWQTLSPALTSGQPYTLSFWYLENPAGGTLTLRLSGSGIAANIDISPGAVSTTAATPGAANSVRASLTAFPQLWLNEILPNNLNGAKDRFGHLHPWAELYNSGATPIDLGGFYLANNYTNLSQWPFPAGATIGAGQFLKVWLDGNPGESIPSELHANFTVPPVTGSLAIVSTSGGTSVLDYLNYTVSIPDRSYGSYPDGHAVGRRTFYFVTPGATNNPAPPPLNVFINEWMADNATTIADPADNDFEDWFEIYNPGDTTANLSGFFFGTSLTNKTQFRIPDGYSIPPRGFLLVWADSESSQNSSNRIDLHTSFKLSKSGDAVGIFAADGTVIDFVSFGPQATDKSEGSYPDGSADSYALAIPTPRSMNILDSSNTPPVVTNIPDQIVIEGQLLLLNVTATDAPDQTLTFGLDGPASGNASINPATGLFSFRAPPQSPSTNLITIHVTDNGAPPMSATTSFNIRVAPRPQVTAITSTATGFAINFVTVPGKIYRVEYKNSLNDNFWSPLDIDMTADGTVLTANDNSGGSAQRFYRINVLN